MTSTPQHAPARRWHRLAWFVYLVAIAASLVDERAHPAVVDTRRQATSVPAFDGQGVQRGQTRIAYDEYLHTKSPHDVPVVLLHGSPGSASDFTKMAAHLADAGYRVYCPDLPGFGDSSTHPPSLSILAHSREMLAFLDQIHIRRAHVVGWSLGGGVAMHMADIAPDRIASLTLMASVSDQSVEGTRSYYPEHAKYAAGYLAASFVRYAVPHFGLLRGFDMIRASMVNFWDTDLRPLTGVMRRLKVPTLILHGRHDFLVPVWNAEHSHDLIGPSTLVITDHSHFYPFFQPELAGDHMLAFFARHDEPGVPAIRQRADLAPLGPARLGEWVRSVERALQHAHWLALLIASTMVLAWRLRTGAVLLLIGVAFGLIDNGIVLPSMLFVQAAAASHAWFRGRRLNSPRIIGRGTSSRTPTQWGKLFRDRPIRTALASRLVPREHETVFEALGFHRLIPIRFLVAAVIAWCLWMLLYFAASIAASAFIAGALLRLGGWVGLISGVLIAIVLVRSLELVLTHHGRRRLRMSWTRLTRREYWPSELLYWPMAPLYVFWGVRYGPLAFTACNPGIESGGGMIGESKKAILDAMPDAQEWVLRSVRVDRGTNPDARTQAALHAIATDPALAFPVILKPDSGYRGFAVKLARSEADVREYFASMHAPAIVQEYHPGPEECGVLWARCTETNGTLHGRIFSITRKTFPIITGDGRRTLAELIHAHPRFHAQAGIFLERWAADRDRVLAAGETLRLAESGNHCQGTLFSDGEDLITPELAARMDALAATFRGGLDIGRFDLRYHSDEALRRGEGFRIIELNGVTGESTNIYDPQRSMAWAFGVAIRQWRLMYQLGAARRKSGHTPMPVRELFKRIREHKRGRSGSSLAD